MQADPLISVIVPVYNVQDYVADCIRSLRRQTLRDFECLVVDDGSTDQSQVRAREAIETDDRFRLITQRNLGLSSARNTGLAEARGALIAFVDSDDRVMQDYLEQMARALMQSEADWVACAMRSVHPNGSGYTHSARHKQPELSDHVGLERCELGSWNAVIDHFPSAWNKLYRRDLIKGLSFPEGRVFEDHAFFYRAAARTNHILHLPEPLYLQTRERPGQITQTDADHVFDQFEALDDIRGVMQMGGKSDADSAFAKIASRLLFERSTVLKDPDRRKGFAQASARYLSERGLDFDPTWSPGLGLHWSLEMQGKLPLSIVLPVMDAQSPGLEHTLHALERCFLPGYELIIPTPDAKGAGLATSGRMNTRILKVRGTDIARARHVALSQAEGRVIVFLMPGDMPEPNAIAHWTDEILSKNATMCVSQTLRGTGEAGLGHMDPDKVAQHPLSAAAFDCATLRKIEGLPLKHDPDGSKFMAAASTQRGGACLSEWPAIRLAGDTKATPSPRVFRTFRTAGPPKGIDFMVPFDPDVAHGLSFEADLAAAPYANLSMLEPDTGQIPFHLSIRRQEQTIVVNTKTSGHWGHEHHHDCALPNGVASIRLIFSDDYVRLRLDDRDWTTLDHAGGGNKIQNVVAADLHGAILSAEPVTRTRPMGELTLDTRWELVARAFSSDVKVRVVSASETLPIVTRPDGKTHLVSALLAGRHWLDCDAGQGLDLCLEGGNRQRMGPVFRLHKRDVAQRINKLALATGAPLDPFVAAHIVEHVHFGALWKLLTPPAQDFVCNLANRLGVAETMPVRGHQRENASHARGLRGPATDPAIDACLRRFWSAIGNNPQHPDALAIVADLALPFHQRRGLFLALTEFFCTTGQDFPGLADMAESEGIDLLDLPHDPEDAWVTSALLPWQLKGRDVQAAIGGMKRLNDSARGWFMTPAIAAIGHAALRDDWLSQDARLDLLRELLRFVRSTGQSYWGRAHCRELTLMMAEAAICGKLHAPQLADDIQSACLEIYALNETFWAALGQSDLPRPLEAARTALTELRRPLASPADEGVALDSLERLGSSEARRFKRDFLGPWETAMPPTNVHDMDAVSAGSRTLRAMAAPGATRQNIGFQKLARQTIADSYIETPQSPHFDLQCQLGQHLTELVGNSSVTKSVSEEILRSLTTVSGPHSQNLGPGLALRAAHALWRADKQIPALQMVKWLNEHHVSTKATGFSAPAWQSAAQRYRAHPIPDLTNLLHPGIRATLKLADTFVARPNEVAAHGLHDVIVLVFSCHAHLGTRIPPMRRGWLAHLARLGVPYLIVVGDGDGRTEGDTLFLDAPDSYEGLPQKTLAAIEWVMRNTSAGHMLKVDDDCFLNVAHWFGSLSYQKFDYYGRRLSRQPGQMDRSWHCAKSTSDRGRLELDKSPEPSAYADGGSGYALSRYAMKTALAQAETANGKRLQQVSFMEDKLLGDLLALGGVSVASEDYRVSIRRRTHKGAKPVAHWLNSFFASQTAPAHLVHLDASDDQARALAIAGTHDLQPPRIWPTHQPPRLGHNSNALELLSPYSRLKQAQTATVAVVAAMRNEMFMLPHFLAHYRRLGVDAFMIADNLSDDGTREFLLDQPDVTVFSADTDYKHAHFGVDWQQAILATYRVGQWSLVADADELLVWQCPQVESLSDLLERPEFDACDSIRTFMLDMYPIGHLRDATFKTGDLFTEAPFVDAQPFLHAGANTGPFSDQPAWVSALRHRLVPGSRPNLFTAQKLALLRYGPHLRLSEGLHFVGGATLSDRELFLAHFKYNAAFYAKAQSEVARRQHFNDAEEYRRYLSLAAEGRDVIYDAAISVPWFDCPFVSERLDNNAL